MFIQQKISLLLMFCLLLSLSSWAQTFDQPGPFEVETAEVTFEDTWYTGEEIPMQVYWPVVDPDSGAAFPVLTFGHGFTIGYLAYENLYRHWASWGHIVTVPDVQRGFNVDQRFPQQLAACLRWAEAEDQRAGAELEGRLSGQFAALGHSFGGASALKSVHVWPEIDAVAAFAPAEGQNAPNVIDSLAFTDQPVMIVSAKGDSVAPEWQHQQPMYEAAAGPRFWLRLLEGGHCPFTDGPNVACDLGALSVGDAGTLSHEEQQGLTLKYVTPFLAYTLRADTAARQVYLCGEVLEADSARVEARTNMCPPTDRRADLKAAGYRAYPNPVEEVLWIEWPNAGVVDLQAWRLVDVWGRAWPLGSPVVQREGGMGWNLEGLPAGMYVVQGPFEGAIRIQVR